MVENSVPRSMQAGAASAKARRTKSNALARGVDTGTVGTKGVQTLFRFAGRR